MEHVSMSTAKIIQFPPITGRVGQGRLQGLLQEADEIGRGFAALNPRQYSGCCNAARIEGDHGDECAYCGRVLD